MLGDFHALLRALLGSPIPVIAAVRGSSLGGGLELALACNRIIAAPGAQLGQPEVKLAVFAPAASVLLPARIGQSAAEDLLLTGRPVGAEEALQLGLVDEIADDPDARAVQWAEEYLAPLSADALRLACRAARTHYAADLTARLQELEDLYLREAAPSADGREGLTAFLEKRAPRYCHA